MADRYLLDTNTASYIIKGNIPAGRRRLMKVRMPQIAISAVTEGELHRGTPRRPEAVSLKTIVDEFPLRVAVLPWDSQATQQYGQRRANLERDGRLGNLAMVIGAHALAWGLILVTDDQAFQRIAKLKVENWTRPDVVVGPSPPRAPLSWPSITTQARA